VGGAFSAGGKGGKLSYRTTVAYDRADKWTKDVADNRVDLTPQFPDPNRSREVQRADVAASYDLGKGQVLAGGGFDNFPGIEVVPLGALRTFSNAGQSGFLRMEVDSGQTRIKGFWNALRMNSGPEYWPSGIQSLTQNVRSDVVDFSATTGFDFKAAGQHHLDLGFGYRFKSVKWGYLATRPDGSAYQENHFNAILQEQWDVTRKLSFLFSYRVDRDPLLYLNNVTAVGLVQSPRGTVLYEFQPEQVLRFTVGSAFREPTFLESYIDLYAPIPNQPALGVRFQGSGALKPEQMVQSELGWRGRFGAFQPDVVVYVERVQNLITDAGLHLPSNPSSAVDPANGQYVIGYTGFENLAGSFFGVGTELTAKWSPADGVDLEANYSYERMFACSAYGDGSGCTHDTSVPNQVAATVGNTAQHKLNLIALWRTKANVDLGLDVHFVSAVSWTEGSFDITRPGGVLYTTYPLSPYTMVNGRVGYRFFQDKLDAGLSFYNLLDDGHREHPFGNQLGRRILASIAGSF